MAELKCIKCNFQWNSRLENPKACPKCKSYRWHMEGTEKLTTSLLIHMRRRDMLLAYVQQIEKQHRTISYIAAKLNINYNTVAQHLSQLFFMGKLKRHRVGKIVYYIPVMQEEIPMPEQAPKTEAQIKAEQEAEAESNKLLKLNGNSK